MKNIVNESWGKLTFDEKNNRLVLILHKTTEEQFKKIIDETGSAVAQYNADNCIADLKNRTGGTEQNVEYSLNVFRSAINKGLKRMAIVLSQDNAEQQLTKSFVSKAGSDQVRSFDNSQDAINWLNSAGGSQRKAA